MSDLLEPLRVLIEGQQKKIATLESVNAAQAQQIDELCDDIHELREMLERAVAA